MKKKFFYNHKNTDDNPYWRHSVYLPQETWKYLKEVAEESEDGVSVSRLINYAIDNERAEKNPFSFECEMPLKFIPNAYIEQAGKIRAFLYKNFKGGLPLNALALFRHALGLSMEDFMCGYAQLLKADQVEYRVKKRKEGQSEESGELNVCLKSEPELAIPKPPRKREIAAQLRVREEDLRRKNEELAILRRELTKMKAGENETK